jgi:hypothetical protein
MTTPTPGTRDFPASAREGVGLDQQAALRFAADRLARDFEGVCGSETSHHARDAAVAGPGGSEPGTGVNPAAIAAMAERGIDISAVRPIRDEVERRVLDLVAEPQVVSSATS